jgi:hypothetical protein
MKFEILALFACVLATICFSVFSSGYNDTGYAGGNEPYSNQSYSDCGVNVPHLSCFRLKPFQCQDGTFKANCSYCGCQTGFACADSGYCLSTIMRTSPYYALEWDQPVLSDGRGIRYVGANSSVVLMIMNLRPNTNYTIQNTNLNDGKVISSNVTTDYYGNVYRYDQTLIKSSEYTVGAYRTELADPASTTRLTAEKGFVIKCNSSSQCENGKLCSNGECVLLKCSDNTTYGACSASKPLFCYNGTLVEYCAVCGCASGTCSSNGSCSENRPPKIAQIADKSVKEGESLEFDVNASDPDDDAVSILASNLPDGAIFDRRSWRFSWTPASSQRGNYWVTFYAVDDGSPPLAEQKTIRITVGDVNKPPEIVPIGDKKTDENILLEFFVNATDPDGQNLTYYASELPKGARLDNRTGRFSWIPDFGTEGNYKIKITVSDGALYASSEFTITVGDINRPPVAVIAYPFANQEFFAGGRIVFSAAGSMDPDPDKLTYSWEFGDGETSASENSTVEHAYQNPGKYNATLEVSDGKTISKKFVEFSVKQAPISDGDGDGVVDSSDKCPDTAQSAEVNAFGCPVPKYKTFENNLTTDFSNIDLTNATNVTIGIPDLGKIEFRKNSLNLVGTNLDKYVEISNSSVTVKSDAAPELNKSAVVTFYNVSFEDPIVSRNGDYCTDCKTLSYENRTFVFSVTHFTTYSLLARVSFTGYCGDGYCSAYETCATCKEDCGICRNESATGPNACDELWVCSGWSTCNELNLLTRECTDVNFCGTGSKKPKEAIECREEQDLTSFALFAGVVMSLVLVYIFTEAYKRKKEFKKMDEFELEKFVKGYLYRGYSAVEIRKILSSKGYTEMEISRILKDTEKNIF